MKAHVQAFLSVAGVVILAMSAFWYFQSPEGTSVKSQGIQSLPPFSATTFDGRKISAEDFKGKVVIVNFWASWCAPCVEEVPSLIKLVNEMKGQVRVIALSNDNMRADIEIFLKSFPGMRNPWIEIVHDGGQGLAMTKMFSVFQLPESYVFDSQGHMARKVVGSINWATPDAISYLKELSSRK